MAPEPLSPRPPSLDPFRFEDPGTASAPLFDALLTIRPLRSPNTSTRKFVAIVWLIATSANKSSVDNPIGSPVISAPACAAVGNTTPLTLPLAIPLILLGNPAAAVETKSAVVKATGANPS